MQRIRYSRYLKTIIILLDLLVIAGIFILYFLKKNPDLVHDEDLVSKNSFSLLLLFSFWILLSGRTKIYNIARNLTYIIFVERVVVHFLLFIIGLVLIRKVSDNQFFSSQLTWFSLYLFSSVIFTKSVVYFVIKYFRSLGINHRNVMFLYENDSTETLKIILTDRKDYGYKIFKYESSEINSDELINFWKSNGIHTLFIPTENPFPDHTRDEIFRLAEANKVHISLIPNISQNDYFFFDLGYIETQPVLNQGKYPLDYYSNYLLKRTFDIVFSILVLVLICSWLFPIIAFLIKRNSKGPVFFVQKRYGFHEEVFNCIKFRTMIVNDDSSTKTTKDNDVRITRIGKFLRRTSLDEMPQFINVLKGEMSVVGPRPHMVSHTEMYARKVDKFMVRHFIKPGITGLAQTNGFRGEVENDKDIIYRVKYDIFYMENWSLLLDIKIIFMTFINAIKGEEKAY
ncbi:MAG: exopolysaccharide biosynthesis polyprenyl glycosylphosphotransferase [Pedobacter sp.]|nr:MAG: exopolysaccharide biosynthesis polyprenyl glycosylphosphotransferase [Pedobacter sp.]